MSEFGPHSERRDAFRFEVHLNKGPPNHDHHIRVLHLLNGVPSYDFLIPCSSRGDVDLDTLSHIVSYLKRFIR